MESQTNEILPEVVSDETSLAYENPEKYASGSFVQYVNSDDVNEYREKSKETEPETNEVLSGVVSYETDLTCEPRSNFYEYQFAPEVYSKDFELYIDSALNLNQYHFCNAGYDQYFDYESFYFDVPTSSKTEKSCISVFEQEKDFEYEREIKRKFNEYIKRIKELESLNSELSKKLKSSKETITRQNNEYEKVLEENGDLRIENRSLREDIQKERNKKDGFKKECERKELLIKKIKKNMPYKASHYSGTGMNFVNDRKRRNEELYSSSGPQERESGVIYEDDRSPERHYKRHKIVYDF